MEWECFWVNLREDNKVSESKMTVSESNMAEFKMAAIIKLSQNEWVKFFVQNGCDGKFKMADIIKMTMNEWSFFLLKMAEFKMHHQIADWISLILCKMAESSEFKMAAIIRLRLN